MISTGVKPPILPPQARTGTQLPALFTRSSMNSCRDFRWRSTVGTVAAVFAGLLTTAEAAHKKLSWRPSSEPNVVGYRVHYGTAPGKYDKTIDVGNVTTTTIDNLKGGGRYVFVVTAYNSAQLESLPSKEASALLQPGTEEEATSLDTETDAAQDSSAPGGTVADSTGSGTTIGNSVAGGAGDNAANTAGDESSGASGAAPSQDEVIDFGTGKSKYTAVVLSSGRDAEHAGMVTLNTTSKGAFTGILTLGGKKHGLKGRFDEAGTASVSVSREKAAPVTVNLQLGSGEESGKLAGTVVDGTATAKVAGARTMATASASAHKGKWTVLLLPPEDSSSGTQAPQDPGFGTVAVGNNGSARVIGTLADGSTFSYGAFIGDDNTLYVYAPLYGNRGALAGALQFGSGSAQAETISGTAQWVKPAGVNGSSLYPEGFQLELKAEGEKYLQPTALLPGAGFPSANGLGTITFSGGGLAQPLAKEVTISSAGKVTVTNPGADKLKLSLNVKTGAFSGTFRDGTSTRPRSFAGVALQKRDAGVGSFVGEDESGRVILSPKK
ncbi:MAG: fibronectin type III domain-containing protein [Verrucomicrobiaceae bacterium]|nr:MAG: fibronectin type III domain-containing protein [Verrucomicrobiaceae bacterium]